MSQPPAVTQGLFGHMPDGREVRIFTLTNRHGLRAKVTEYGAILVSMETPDRDGRLADITLGFDTLDEWRGHNSPYFGATIGRIGNRIGGGGFTLDGRRHELAANSQSNGLPCHLHGGVTGFDKALWQGRATSDRRVEFRRRSPAGEEGYPGNLEIIVTYTLTDDNELVWDATAVTDAPTVVNMVNHTYWNLSGNPAATVLDHELEIAASHYLPTDAGMIPTGEIAPVAGTPLDFTRPHAIGARIGEDFEALRLAGGYDHCWVLGKSAGVRFAARVRHPQSGRAMEVLTDQPGIQFYSGNFLDGSIAGKGGVTCHHRTGLCLETENFPDAPNKPQFPSAVLRPGETYRHAMIHRFSAE
jgi:aldose 1-epimerase